MELTTFSFSLFLLPTLLTIVQAQNSLTLWLPLPPDDGSGETDSLTIPTPTAWVDPLGTASDGSETTFLYNEVDSGDAALFGDVQTGTEVVTTSFTMIASASGFRMPDILSMSAECTLESSNTGGCVYVALADVDGTSLVTVTETGLPVSFYEVPISAATGSSADSASSSPTTTAKSDNGATLTQQISLLGSITVGLLVTGFIW